MAMSGKPAIANPRDFNLRAFQLAVGNISERFRLLDTAVSNLQSTTGDNSLQAQVSNLQQQIISLQQRLTTVEASRSVAPRKIAVYSTLRV